MLLAAPLTALLVFSISATAKSLQVDRSPVTLSLARQLNLTSFHNLVHHDQARAKQLMNRTDNSDVDSRDAVVNTSSTAYNQAVVYTASISIGTPPTMYSLIVDTGSSNTWIGAEKPYTSGSGTLTGSIRVSYGSGEFTGLEYNDNVTITSLLTIPKQSIGVSVEASGFDSDGILGIGPVDLTKGTLYPNISEEIPTPTDNLFKAGLINSTFVSISFQPTNKENDLNGELTWGGVDDSKYNGPITYIPVTSTSPASKYWGIDQSIHYGQNTTILSTTAGIVDTGTTLILLATDAYDKYAAATGAVFDQNIGLLTISLAQYGNLSSLYFKSGNGTFELTPNAQIFPRSLNTVIGGNASQIYLMIADLGSDSGTGLDFINGYAFLERFYSVFDTQNKRVGLATTPFTYATNN